MASERGYLSGYHLLEINGQSCGFVHSVEGGYPYAEAVGKPLPTGGVDKEPGEARWMPIVLTFGAGSEQPLYDWMAAMITGTQTPTDGAVVFVDYNRRELWRLEFDRAIITELKLPALDAAGKEHVFMTLTVTPLVTRRVVQTSVADLPGSSRTNLQLLPSSFVLSILGLDTHRVTTIEPIVLTQPMADSGPPAPAGPVDVGNIRFTASEADMDLARAWLDDFVVGRNYGPSAERTGSLSMLDPNRNRTIFRFDFRGLGILRVAPHRVQGSAEAIARADVELYCEGIAFTADLPKSAATGSSDTATEVVITNLTVDTTGQPAEEATNDPEKVAARLVMTGTQVMRAKSEDPARLRGQDIGRRWAKTTATLGELEAIAALEGTSWSALALGPDHSLNQTLQGVGIIVGNGGGVDLQRDAFAEGVVSGAADVYRSVQPHLPDAPTTDRRSALP